MKYECIHDCQLGGRYVFEGQVLDLDPEGPQAKRPCFRPLAEKPPEEGLEGPGGDAISRVALMQKLDELGVAYKAREKYESLLAKFKDATDPKRATEV